MRDEKTPTSADFGKDLSPSRRGKRFVATPKLKNNRPLRNKRGKISRAYFRQTLKTPIRDQNKQIIGYEMRTVIFPNPKRAQKTDFSNLDQFARLGVY